MEAIGKEIVAFQYHRRRSVGDGGLLLEHAAYTHG